MRISTWQRGLGLFLTVNPINGIAVTRDNDVDVIRDDSYFFGQSPPVYPSRKLSQ
jgi:hypothetical protein